MNFTSGTCVAFLSALYAGCRTALADGCGGRPDYIHWQALVRVPSLGVAYRYDGVRGYHGEQYKRTLTASGRCLTCSSRWIFPLNPSRGRMYVGHTAHESKEELRKGQPSLHVPLTTSHADRQRKGRATSFQLCVMKILTWPVNVVSTLGHAVGTFHPSRFSGSDAVLYYKSEMVLQRSPESPSPPLWFQALTVAGLWP